MSQSSETVLDEDDVARGNATIEITVPAEPDQLAVIRAVAGAVAAQRDFDPDAIADLTLAVDESCTRLIRRALPGAVLDCRFALTENGIGFRASTPVDPGTSPSGRNGASAGTC
ncbi:ATP-binding protein [Rhodococcus maanshanensis]|uniref:Serine/threonine-protein kinase RsbW n=1 Tax=Rhodococcus maanshanensis TaxID=183556 RepID=A0A1H7LQ88_9NOCA|nr:ATP-binding protein [Rhodococcus maanshanensis]SEL01066.1 serine/threonine-protein kinase RsbW [Rhodococcus maanshanensis]